MQPNNILSSLCYFSVFFAPFLFPIIVYFVAETNVKKHAKSALGMHLVPFITVVGLIIVTIMLGFSNLSDTVNGGVLIAVGMLAVIINIYYFILNIIRGIKVLNENE
ncbi:DUF4870 domain-containing protein [Virgibacillus chiguensis]|uniref:DUF4870 domain-containing protein n=1 Tax=Virgibacillus chiguensis TaxID=411959 RepID=A0A1M5MCD5_9BACI|nr:DUF4870 domain-containing protein [Virgibacillus chiguensis]SHG74891.1 protein of unknown function [Virgibacillus chiguensis]